MQISRCARRPFQWDGGRITSTDEAFVGALDSLAGKSDQS